MLDLKEVAYHMWRYKGEVQVWKNKEGSVQS